MSKALAEAFGALAEALEAAAAATRSIEGAYVNAGTKSADASGDAVAGGAAGSAGKGAGKAGTVAGKTAKGGKAKPPAVTFEDVKSALTELMNLKGKDVVRTLISDFGAAKLTDVEEEQYAEILAKAKEAMVEEEEEAGADDSDDMFGE